MFLPKLSRGAIFKKKERLQTKKEPQLSIQTVRKKGLVVQTFFWLAVMRMGFHLATNFLDYARYKIIISRFCSNFGHLSLKTLKIAKNDFTQETLLP